MHECDVSERIVPVLCQSVSGDGPAAARVDTVSQTDRAKGASDAGQLASVVCSMLNDCRSCEIPAWCVVSFKSLKRYC